jgi:hypothetical protein
MLYRFKILSYARARKSGRRWLLTLRSRRALAFVVQVLLGFDQSEGNDNVKITFLAFFLRDRLLELFRRSEFTALLGLQGLAFTLRQSQEILFVGFLAIKCVFLLDCGINLNLNEALQTFLERWVLLCLLFEVMIQSVTSFIVTFLCYKLEGKTGWLFGQNGSSGFETYTASCTFPSSESFAISCH